MSKRLDLPIAVLVWLLGFAWVRRGGSWAPLALMACLLAARLAILDAETRRLLALSPKRLVLGVVGAVAMASATYLIYAPLSRLFPGLPEATRELYLVLNRDGYPPVVLALLVVIISSAEEIVWRGRLLSGVAPSSAGRVVGLATLYGASHVTSGSFVLAGLAVGCGLVWGTMRVASRSLWPAILMHALWDIAVLVFRPLA